MLIGFIIYIILASFTLFVMIREDKKKGILFLSDITEDTILSLSLIPIILFLIKYLTLVLSKTANVVVWKKTVDNNSPLVDNTNLFDSVNEEELERDAEEFGIEEESYEKVFEEDQDE